MSDTDPDRDAVEVLRFRRAKNDATLEAELKRASKQQRVVARAVPYQRYDYTVEEYVARHAARQSVKQRLHVTAKGPTSLAHENSSYKGSGTRGDRASATSEHLVPRYRGNPKKAPIVKRKKRGRHQQADLTIDELRQTVQQGQRKMNYQEHSRKCSCSKMGDADVQSVHVQGKVGTAHSTDEKVDSTNNDPANTASALMLDTVNLEPPATDHDVPAPITTSSKEAELILEVSQAGYSLVDAPGQQPLSEILERKRMYSSLHRRLDDERLEMYRTRAQLNAIHKETKIKDSPTTRPFSTMNLVLNYCDDADPNTREGSEVNNVGSTDRVLIPAALHDPCDGIASEAHRGTGTIVNKKATIRRVSGTDIGMDSSSGAAMDTHKEIYDEEGATGMMLTKELGSDRPTLSERTWRPGSFTTKEVMPSPAGKKTRGDINLVSCGKKIKAKIKRLLRVKGKSSVGRSQKETKRTINAWSNSVIGPWELTRREDLNWGMPYDQWVDEWGVDIKRTVIPGSLATKALANNVNSGHIPKQSDFRNKEELWLYLHPEFVGNVPHDLKSMCSDGGSCSSPSSNATSEDRAELPAYDEVMSADARTLLGAAESQKGKSKATAYRSTSFQQAAPIRPEDLWLYTPRSCTTCGDFGLLPLHYCVECKKLRVDMCSECYGLGHDSCQSQGHEVTERQRIQQFLGVAKTASASPPVSIAPEQESQKIDGSQNMEQLLKFLTEERLFMREEIERARSEKAAAEQLAAHDAAEATAFRIAKLKLLPTLISDGKFGSPKEQKSSISINGLALSHSNSVRNEECQTDGKSETRSSGPEEASSEMKTQEKPPEQSIQQGNMASSRLPKLTSPAADAPQPLDNDKELIDMDARLRKQEQLQAFRERELCLRETEYSLRDREILLDLKERELNKPGYVPLGILPRDSMAYPIFSTLSMATDPSKCPKIMTDLPRHAPDMTPEDPSPILESSVSCSEAPMSAYSPSSSDASLPDSPIVANQVGSHLSALVFKHLLSKIFRRVPRKGIRTHAEKRNRQSGTPEYAPPAKKSKSGTSPSSRKRAGKPPLSRSNSARSDRSGTDSGSNKRRKQTATTKAVSGRLLVCPYAKYDPDRYSSSNTTESQYRRCGSHTLRDIPRLKQHLYRVHQRPEFHCPRCYSEFTSVTEVNEHARQRTQCATAPCPYPEKFDSDQLRELKKRQQGKNEAESWFFIFKVLFPHAEPPVDPYEEDFGTRLATRLGSYGASNRFAQMVTEQAGAMDDETQLRVRQAIQELLPVFVQQTLQPSVTSANSSSTSLLRSSTTPESSPGDETMIPEPRMKQPNLHPLDASQNLGNRTFPNQQQKPRPITPFSMTNSTGSSSHDLEASTPAHSYCQSSIIRTTKVQQSDGRQRPHSQNASMLVPMLYTSDSQGSMIASLRPSHVEIPKIAPPPMPQHFFQETTLEPKASRRSMDSGYVSMHTRQPNTTDEVEFSMYNGDAPNSGNSLSVADYSGSASGDSRWNLQDSHWPWNDNTGTSQESTSSWNDIPPSAIKQTLVRDLPRSQRDSSEQHQAIPGSFPQDSHTLCHPTLNFSDCDPYLPSMNNASQDDGLETPSLYESIEEKWAGVDSNPWGQDDSIWDGGVS